MIDLSKAKVGDKFITRNGVVVEYVLCQSRIYDSEIMPYYVRDYIFNWEITPGKLKFLTVNQFGLTWPPFQGKWDIIKKVSSAKSNTEITIF